MWKLANVTPIFEKGDKPHTPISLLPICGKILENIVFNNLYTYLHTNNLITKNESGFRPGDFTPNQLLYLLDEIHQAFDSTIQQYFLTFLKLLTRCGHDGLIFKLVPNGISRNLLNLFQNYLSNRKQRVAQNGSYCDYSSIESGAPQGSVLGPLLFLVYINDLERNIISNIQGFC